MADGWRCPECHLILAPDVREHRCDPPEAGVSVRPVVAPYSPSSGETRTWTSPNITVTPGGTYTGTVWTTGGGGGGSGWTPPAGVSSVTVTATNACNVYGDCGHASCAVAVREPVRLIVEDAA
jgi:hypothetical protein